MLKQKQPLARGEVRESGKINFFFLKNEAYYNVPFLLLNKMQMICKDFSAIKHLGACKANISLKWCRNKGF